MFLPIKVIQKKSPKGDFFYRLRTSEKASYSVGASGSIELREE